MTAGSFNILASVKHVALQSITHIKKKYEKYAKNFFKDTLKFKWDPVERMFWFPIFLYFFLTIGQITLVFESDAQTGVQRWNKIEEKTLWNFPFKCLADILYNITHRRTINTEEKAKVVAAV